MSKLIQVKRSTVLADARRARTARSEGRSSLVRVGQVALDAIDTTSPTPPVGWPSKLSWPPSESAPPGWPSSVRWPPATLTELTAGIAGATSAEGGGTAKEAGKAIGGAIGEAMPQPKVSAAIALSPGQKDAMAAGSGAILGGVVGKLALASTAVPAAAAVLGGVLIGAILGHVVYALATGNELTKVATKGVAEGAAA